MSDALATRWVEAGHEVRIAGRTPAKAAALARRLGGSAAQGSFREAVEFGDVILLAVRHEGVVGTVEAAGGADGAFAGKTIIDCTNPVEVDQFTLVIDSGTSLAEEIQRLAKGSTVIKAFNLCQARVWQMRPPRFDARVLAVPYCGDGETAKQVARILIADLGCVPLDAGPLRQARHLEAMAAIVIRLLHSGFDPYTVFNLISPTVHQPAASVASG